MVSLMCSLAREHLTKNKPEPDKFRGGGPAVSLKLINRFIILINWRFWESDDVTICGTLRSLCDSYSMTP